MECKTWEEQKNVECCFRVGPFGSSVNLRCTIHSDLDLVVRLRPEFVNNETKNEVSEKIQEACGWNADVLWYDRICNSECLMDNVLKGVQIL